MRPLVEEYYAALSVSGAHTVAGTMTGVVLRRSVILYAALKVVLDEGLEKA